MHTDMRGVCDFLFAKMQQILVLLVVKYPVAEKERLHGRESQCCRRSAILRNLESTGEETNRSLSGHVWGTGGGGESESDSLTEFGTDNDRGYNEDGSFVNIYGPGSKNAGLVSTNPPQLIAESTPHQQQQVLNRAANGTTPIGRLTPHPGTVALDAMVKMVSIIEERAFEAEGCLESDYKSALARHLARRLHRHRVSNGFFTLRAPLVRVIGFN
ncbi:hypothetical protein GPALN_010630 [Globodera pallida]|nr:hypothetical protein GPALN_010630 [Globodera pallida]